MNTLLDPDILTWAASIAGEEPKSATQVRSNEVNRVFRLDFARQSVFLKIGPNLQREYDRLRWLEGRLPAPQPLGFTTHLGADAVLMSAIEGKDLAELNPSLPPPVTITRLATALKAIHATNTESWSFERNGSGGVLVHGDACLPNFLYQSDHFSGCIDVGDMRVDSPDVDLAATVWSLQYNLGPGHGLAFLREYGVEDANEENVERLRLMYEQS